MSFIFDVIETHYTPAEARLLFYNSYLLQYLEKKTKSVDRSSKSRGSFANIYAIYVLTEDYIKKVMSIPKRIIPNISEWLLLMHLPEHENYLSEKR